MIIERSVVAAFDAEMIRLSNAILFYNKDCLRQKVTWFI
jgi:hypothetical protein